MHRKYQLTAIYFWVIAVLMSNAAAAFQMPAHIALQEGQYFILYGVEYRSLDIDLDGDLVIINGIEVSVGFLTHSHADTNVSDDLVDKLRPLYKNVPFVKTRIAAGTEEGQAIRDCMAMESAIKDVCRQLYGDYRDGIIGLGELQSKVSEYRRTGEIDDVLLSVDISSKSCVIEFYSHNGVKISIGGFQPMAVGDSKQYNSAARFADSIIALYARENASPVMTIIGKSTRMTLYGEKKIAEARKQIETYRSSGVMLTGPIYENMLTEFK